MARYEVKNPLTPEGRNQLNAMFEELYKEYTGAGLNAKEAREKALQSVLKSNEAMALSERTQKELSQAILKGDSSPLGGQLSVGADGTIHDNPQERFVNELNSVNRQMAQRATTSYVDTLMSNITDGSPKELFYSVNALTEKYPNGTTGPILVFDSSFTDGAHSFIWNEGALVEIETDFTWRLGSLSTASGKPMSGNVTRVRNVEYTYLNEGVIGLTDYSNYKIMVFQFNQDNDDSFIKSSDWFTDDYRVQEAGYYRVLIAYHDDRNIGDQEVYELGRLLKIQSGGMRWVDVGVYQATGVPKKSIGLEKLDENALDIVLPNVKIGSEMDWRLGSFHTGSGKPPNPDDNTTRIRSLEYTHVTKGNLVGLSNYNNHKFMVFQYSSPRDATFITASPWLSRDYIIEQPCFIKILLAFSDDRDISDVDKAEMPNLLKIMTNKVGNENILDGSITTNKLSKEVKDRLTNIEDSIDAATFDVDDLNFTVGSGSTATGENVDSTTRITSDYILVHPSTINFEPATDSKYLVLLYDINLNYMSFIPWRTEKSSIDIKEKQYVRVLLAYVDDRQVTELDIPILRETIKSNTRLEPTSNSGGYYFRGPAIPAIPTGENALKYDDFITQTWESLRATYPEHITRNTIIKDTSNTFDIYEYVFTPEHYEKTVFLTAGIHGDEYEGFWGLYYFMKNIYDDSYKYKQLRDLRHNVRFVIVPVLSPWGLENRVRATSRVSNANNNYDVFHKSPEYESPAGAFGFSENEALAVKLVADKYDADFDFYADFHTDRYDPQNGNYILINQLSSTMDISKQLTIDEVAYLKDEYGFNTIMKPHIVNINRRSSSFKYMEAVRGVPSAILEVGTGRMSPIGSSTTITVAVDWFTNIIVEMLKHDLRAPKQIDKGYEKSVVEGRQTGYVTSVLNNIPDDGLQVYINHKDFNGDSWSNKAERGDLVIQGLTSASSTPEGIKFIDSRVSIPATQYNDFAIVLKAKINSVGKVLSSENGSLMLEVRTHSADSTRYNIYNGNDYLVCSALKYNQEVTIGVKSQNGRLHLYVNGEPFNDITASHQTESQLYIGANSDFSDSVDMTLKSLALYNKTLKDDEIGFVFKNFIKH